ncbi:hypothetical protein [Halopseudomonas salina]|uniref:Photosynthetic complex assembly protein n=1 Tax=Halopseudomonas salina TaxID=1323744 RepID=A0ABQ1PSG6_9GAMM|nr:hypothetical protein [Halopseudomonas salina]GGD02315.1 hypothetical protein GCM10007418_21880 [Halopseudomonas salina]
MTTTRTSNTKRIPGWIKALFILVLLGCVSLVAWQQLPRAGVSTDLSVIGMDKPALVLTRDNNLVGGGEVLDLLREAQPQYGERVYLRVAHQGQEDGRAFARDHNSRDGDLVLLDAEGEVISGPVLPQSYADVQALLAEIE